MARLPRLVVPGEAHYLMLRVLAGLCGPAAPGLCADASDREALIAALREAAGTEGVRVHAYAVLPGELHVLATPERADSLGRLVQALGRRYVGAYNRRHARSGTLWDGRFRCAVVEGGAPRLAVLQLIDALSAEPGATSAAHRTGGSRNAMLVDPPEIWLLGNTPFDRESAYRTLLATGLPAGEAEQIRSRVLGGWVIGSAAFAATLAANNARPALPRPRGRPRRATP